MISGVDKSRWLEQQAVPLTDLGQLGTTLVVAPHPDDESLGCGGTIARLRQSGYPVHVLFVSDGSMSHPNSPSFPAERLRALREAEAREAVQILGVAPEQVTFLRLPDSRVPTPGEPEFREAVTSMRQVLTRVKPTTVLVPWRRDPHRDHRASWQMLQTALENQTEPPRVLEYLIWLWELGSEADMPQADEMNVWRVAIDSVLAQRNQAIAAHRSQVTRLIDDDPTAFYLSPELLTHFDAPRELFLEVL
ncbi:PIG-L family deacetylase [Spirosoma taeanense]|uniref:PIG-L family deacetylase n=1 Tax=Spirosoma taeanense TaxID=2735870 RepID=A0A6M5Y822_9BACT|nr:PIG-L family deacetylase [Spirosoma taeanense]QJW90065.1 PIG-L family deacetylase [Spirosoma taeanense]